MKYPQNIGIKNANGEYLGTYWMHYDYIKHPPPQKGEWNYGLHRYILAIGATAVLIRILYLSLFS